MKKIKERLEQLRENSSIRMKWGLISSLTFFVTYIVFSLLLIFSLKNWALSAEEESLFDLRDQLVSKLSRRVSPLTSDDVEQSIDYPELYFPDQSRDDLAVTTDEFVYPAADLKREGLIISVYDNDQEEIYQTEPHHYAFKEERVDQLEEIKEPGLNGLVIISSVHSHYTGKLLGYVQMIDTLDSYQALTDKLYQMMWIVGALAVVLSFSTGFFLANNFLRPIKRLTSAMSDIRRDPESETRLFEGNRKNELEELAVAYNSMVDLMQNNIENQRRFVEDVSHELRTPVSVVEGYLNILNRWGKEDEEILEESITVSLQEIKRMKMLVQEMLDLSRAEQVGLQLVAEQTDLVEVLKQTHANFEMLYPDFLFTLDIDSKGPVISEIGRNHFEQILIILLDNAVKYSTDRFEIHISLSTEMRYATLAIQDFGLGISAEDLPNIFNRFYRVDKARSRQSGGTGLGLPIAKELVEGYGGEISVESMPEYGSVFRLRFPIYREPSEQSS